MFTLQMRTGRRVSSNEFFCPKQFAMSLLWGLVHNKHFTGVGHYDARYTLCFKKKVHPSAFRNN